MRRAVFVKGTGRVEKQTVRRQLAGLWESGDLVQLVRNRGENIEIRMEIVFRVPVLIAYL